MPRHGTTGRYRVTTPNAAANDPLGPFVAHVCDSWRGHGQAPAARALAERDVRAFIAASSADGAGRDPAHEADRERRVARLLDDPPLLAALFQHMDVLFASRAREAAGVAAIVMATAERAADAEERATPLRNDPSNDVAPSGA